MTRTAAGAAVNSDSAVLDATTDGSYAVIVSNATDLGGATGNPGVSDVFLWERATGNFQLLSVPAPGATANGDSRNAAISDPDANGDFADIYRADLLGNPFLGGQLVSIQLAPATGRRFKRGLHGARAGGLELGRA